MTKYLVITVIAALMSSAAVSQTTINIDDPTVTAGSLNANAGALSNTSITGMNAIIESADIPSNIKMENVPNVTPPSLVGGNPCSVGVSGGGSILGFGISAAVMKEGVRCELRQSVALLANMGFVKESLVMFCMGNEDVSEMFRSLGMGCTELATATPEQMNPIMMQQGKALHSRSLEQAIPISSSRIATARDCSDSDYQTQVDGSWDEMSKSCQNKHRWLGIIRQDR